MKRTRCHAESMSTMGSLPGASAILFTTRRAWRGRMRAGASVGYTHYRPDKSLNPF